MIAYHILCHDNFPQVVSLVESLYHRDDCFLIDIDDGKSPNTRALSALKNRSNVHIIRDANIAWGGAGTLRKTIRGAFKLLQLRKDWQYYVVLSGQDLPIKSNHHIKQALASREHERINFIRGASPERIDAADLPLMNKSTEIKLLADRGHTKIYIKPCTVSIQQTMYVRILLDVTEVGEKGEVYLETAEPLLMRSRDDYFKRYPFYAGANWFNLHRSLIEYMLNDPFAYELYDKLRTTFIPDESYFQTYIMNSPFRDTVDRDIGRLILRPSSNPGVKVLSLQDLPEIEQTSALYARKFDTRKDPALVERVLQMCA